MGSCIAADVPLVMYGTGAVVLGAEHSSPGELRVFFLQLDTDKKNLQNQAQSGTDLVKKSGD